jgi:hypothetical protein
VTADDSMSSVILGSLIDIDLQIMAETSSAASFFALYFGTALFDLQHMSRVQLSTI